VDELTPATASGRASGNIFGRGAGFYFGLGLSPGKCVLDASGVACDKQRVSFCRALQRILIATLVASALCRAASSLALLLG
jgi:hypothetical protein